MHITEKNAKHVSVYLMQGIRESINESYSSVEIALNSTSFIGVKRKKRNTWFLYIRDEKREDKYIKYPPISTDSTIEEVYPSVFSAINCSSLLKRQNLDMKRIPIIAKEFEEDLDAEMEEPYDESKDFVENDDEIVDLPTLDEIPEIEEPLEEESPENDEMEEETAFIAEEPQEQEYVAELETTEDSFEEFEELDEVEDLSTDNHLEETSEVIPEEPAPSPASTKEDTCDTSKDTETKLPDTSENSMLIDIEDDGFGEELEDDNSDTKTVPSESKDSTPNSSEDVNSDNTLSASMKEKEKMFNASETTNKTITELVTKDRTSNNIVKKGHFDAAKESYIYAMMQRSSQKYCNAMRVMDSIITENDLSAASILFISNLNLVLSIYNNNIDKVAEVLGIDKRDIYLAMYENEMLDK